MNEQMYAITYVSLSNEEHDLMAQLDVEKERWVRPWYADITNYLVTKIIPIDLSYQQKNFAHDAKL